MELAVIIPTRGRPQNAARVAQAFRDTDVLHAVPVFVADLDDPVLPDYRRLVDDGRIDRLMINEVAGGHGLCGPLNWAAVRYAELYGAVGFMGDDHLPRTTGWDDRILDALDSPEPRIVYGNDLLQGPNLPTAVFMQSRMIAAMRMMAPQVMRHLYLDNFWKELGEAVGGLVYLPDVIIEHIHPAAGKAAMDDGYQRIGGYWDADESAWRDYRRDGRFDQVVQLIKKEYGK